MNKLKTQRKKQTIAILLLAIIPLGQGWSAPTNHTAFPPEKECSLLKQINGNMYFSVCHYNGNHLISEEKLNFIPQGELYTASIENGHAALTLQQKNAAVINVRCCFRLDKGTERQTGVAFRINFNDWSKQNFVMIPAAAYNGNRFHVLPVNYPPAYDDTCKGKKNLPLIITDVPRLNISEGPSKMELTTGDATTPAFSVYFPALQKGLLLFFTQQTELGNSGIIMEESGDRKQASVLINAPAIREKKYGNMHLYPSGDTAPDLTKGDTVTLAFQIHVFDCRDIPGLYAYFFNHRKNMTGPNPMENRIPFSEALQMECSLQNNSEVRWYEKGGYYKNGNGDSPFGNIQIGWVGGLMQTYPLIMEGDSLSLKRSFSTINVVMNNMTGQSGFLYGIYKDGVVYGDQFRDMDKIPYIAMIRKNADVLHFMLKQFNLLKQEEKGNLINPVWEVKMKNLADAFVKLWYRYGEFGQLVNVETGKLVISGSTAGAMAPAALAMASQYFNEPKYLQVAKQSAEMYFNRDVKNGYTTGGPGEILQCPDSESAFAMLESFVVLYEATRDAKWLRYAETMAAICSSWVVSYDYTFPPVSALAQCHAHSTGAVWASIQNKHAAPGICTASGDCLLKLYRATGNTKYLELLKDIAHNILEFMSTEKRPVGSNKNGYINERVNLSDWEGSKGVGGNLFWGSVSWCELSVMLTTVEIPGIYIRPSEKLVYVFDHLSVKQAEDKTGRIILNVKNTTSYPSVFSILADDEQLIGNLNRTFFVSALPNFRLNPDEEITLRISKTGRIEKL